MALRDQWSQVLAVPAVVVPREMDTHPYALSSRPASASVAPAPSPASPHCCKWQWRQLEEPRENKCCSFNSNFLARNHQRNSEAEVQWMHNLFFFKSRLWPFLVASKLLVPC